MSGDEIADNLPRLPPPDYVEYDQISQWLESEYTRDTLPENAVESAADYLANQRGGVDPGPEPPDIGEGSDDVYRPGDGGGGF